MPNTPVLTKVKVNNTVYYFKDSDAHAALANKADNTLATSSSDGLMSAADKEFLDGLNPDVEAHLTNINHSEF